MVKDPARACLGQLGSYTGEVHGSSTAGATAPVTPVAHSVSGQEVAWPIVTPATLEGRYTLVLKHLLLDWACSCHNNQDQSCLHYWNAASCNVA